ncbi:hypothetical protein Q1695_015349 [Nippostrongylus brasiliensis]|nr:hypothetical protein Q1695_015349 [Nippostrongylus brasiliensis]
MIVSDNTMSIEQIPGMLVDVLKSNEMLQEQLRRQQAELEELRALRQKFEAQQKELEKWKERVPGEPQVLQRVVDGETPGWLRKICEADGLDLAAAHGQLITSWIPEEDNRYGYQFLWF